MSAHASLRAATRAAHDRVDFLFSGFDLAEPGAYRHFMTAQAAAFIPIEAALDAAGAAEHFPDWTERRRSAALRADLVALDLALPAPLAAPAFATPAEIAGGAYVLEGSRLGGAMLARRLPHDSPRAFLAAPQPPAQWRTFLARLEQLLGSHVDRSEAARKAEQVFAVFASAAQLPTGNR